MLGPIKILVPTFLLSVKILYLKGFVYISKNHTVTIYLTKYSPKEYPFENECNTIYGYYGGNFVKKQHDKFKNALFLQKSHNFKSLKLTKLVINNRVLLDTSDIIILLYDYDSVKVSQTIPNTLDDFSKLQSLILLEEGESTLKNDYKLDCISPSWFASSMFLQHSLNCCKLLTWLLTSMKKDKKISLKQGNLILAIITDLILGYIVLQLVCQERQDISSILMGALEKLINLLYTLLKWLMGAPVGLKLNNAFNKMLGKYFSYHVQLWWLFLGEKLDMVLQIYNYVGYLGLTFQTAVIADLICLATFHSYCIYVYAARLFNFQIAGIIALFRLFVGRKYNPLRGGIDSCEYTNQELFVGTVGFTILLLLLPTTALYYIVFTLFRVLSIAVQYILANLIYLLQSLPLYVVSLWLTRSPKVAGNIFIEVINKEENLPLVLKAKLFSNSLKDLIKTFQPPVDEPKEVKWTNILSNMLIGKQLEYI